MTVAASVVKPDASAGADFRVVVDKVVINNIVVSITDRDPFTAVVIDSVIAVNVIVRIGGAVAGILDNAIAIVVVNQILFEDTIAIMRVNAMVQLR